MKRKNPDIITQGNYKACSFNRIRFWDRWHIPHQSDSIVHFGGNKSKDKQFSQRLLRILIWNVHKGIHGQWSSEFELMQKNYDIFFLQEAGINRQLSCFHPFDERYHWYYAENYHSSRLNKSIGMLTGSRHPFLYQKFRRSTVFEPFTRTPKSTLFSWFRCQNNSDPVLFINTHLINFRFNRAFIKHLHQILEIIDNHHGAVLLAGDFNTWNRKRMKIVRQQLNRRRLSEIPFANDPRKFRLDHVFHRDLKIHSAELLSKVHTSDHFPISVDIGV